MKNPFLFLLCLSLFCSLSGSAQEESKNLDQVLFELCGSNCLSPSAESLVGQYILETRSRIMIRKFWRAPQYSQFPPHELGPDRLIVPVSKSTFQVFLKYFSSKHFLFLLNRHGNQAAFEGKSSAGIWNGQVLTENFSPMSRGELAIPVILDSEEGTRAENYFALAKIDQHLDLARRPWGIRSADGKGYYCTSGVFSTGCGTWIGNMPIGNETTTEYFFASGDSDGSRPAHQILKPYKMPNRLSRKTKKLMEKVWTVPGHRQLGEILDPMANRRGEFDNAGWTTTTFLASASTKRVPVVFLFVQNVRKPIPKDFSFIIDSVD